MKRKITLAIDRQLLKRARALAAQQDGSIGGLVDVLEKLVKGEQYQHAKARALARLASGFHLGGGKMPTREELHDRQRLRTDTLQFRGPIFR